MWKRLEKSQRVCLNLKEREKKVSEYCEECGCPQGVCCEQRTIEWLEKELNKLEADFKDQKGYGEREGYVISHLKFLINSKEAKKE